MAEALQELLGERLSRGVVVTKRGHAAGHALAPRIEVVEASHPTPDASSVDASARVLELVGAAGAKTLVLCCISGGASALLCAPVEGVSLEEKREATRQLLACGCPIGDKNAVPAVGPMRWGTGGRLDVVGESLQICQVWPVKLVCNLSADHVYHA